MSYDIILPCMNAYNLVNQVNIIINLKHAMYTAFRCLFTLQKQTNKKLFNLV